MNKLSSRIFLLAVMALALALLLPFTVANAHPLTQPRIPHPLAGHTDCVSCHATGANGAPQYPADHAGRTNDMCQLCHKPAAPAAPTAAPTKAATAAPSATPAASATTALSPTLASSPTLAATSAPADTATPSPTAAVQSSPSATAQAEPAGAGGPPLIPHTLQGRDNCLACHETGSAGAPKVPADHAGRTIEMCRGCHQPMQAAGSGAPQAVPTRIVHPAAPAKENSCVTCHSGLGGNLAAIVNDWQSSIHSERNVSCADCHGGDPTKQSKEEAMAASAGFVGVPKKADIPGLCASCHANVDTMRQYELPTDQWAQYQQSVHGKRLAQGDTNVATCFTCHDGHATKPVNDPAAQVYATNVPALCASCHANAELIKPYGIPTDQYDQYKKSIHGTALLEKQDTRAPNCATCHGTHGAAPPGVQEVANVCGSCHSATQTYYAKSAHASGGQDAPQCVTCHGRHDVSPPSEAMLEGSADRQCGSCHAANSPQAQTVQAIDQNLKDAAAAASLAEQAIQRAQGSALITAPEEVKLAEARTSLITARAAQHSLDVKTIKTNTDKATATAKQIVADSDKAIADSVFRREFMAVGLGIMALAIGSLYIIRRELYKQLPKEE